MTPVQGIAIANMTREAISLSFVEEMRGRVTLDRTYGDGGDMLSFRLTISISDVDAFIADRAHPAVAAGALECAAFGGERAVRGGTFNLFTSAGDASTKHMRYLLPFTDEEGAALTLIGIKTLRDDPGVDLWGDTRTLDVWIVRGHEGFDAPDRTTIVGRGILRLEAADFAKQLTTMDVEAASPAEAARGLEAFGAFFAGSLWEVYGPHTLRSEVGRPS